MELVMARSWESRGDSRSPTGFQSAESIGWTAVLWYRSCFASIQSSSGEGSNSGPGSGWFFHSWLRNEKSWSQRNENMCIGRLPLLNGPGGQMAFYVVFTTAILDWLPNLFVFLTQLPASCLAFSLTRTLRAGFEQLRYFFLFLTTIASVPASTTQSLAW